MRRNRPFANGSDIQGKLPSDDLPQSRVITRGEEAPLKEAVLDARDPAVRLERDAWVDRVICGDSASVLSRLPSGSVSLAITSPPYWNLVDYGFEGQIGQGSYADYRARLTEVWREVARVLRPNGKFALNVPLMPIQKAVSERHFGKTHTRFLIDLYSDLRQDILRETELLAYGLFIWEKQTTEKMFGSYPYPPNLYERNYIEFIAVFVKPGEPPKVPSEVKDAAKLTQRQWMELTSQIWWMYPENIPRNTGHPAPFPEALPNRLINMYTFPGVESAGFPGDIVLDPFAGWGTTCVAAKRLKRRFVGIDLSPAFCNHALTRLGKTTVSEKPVIMSAERPTKIDRRQAVFG
jgi:DNA modification methylase